MVEAIRRSARPVDRSGAPGLPPPVSRYLERALPAGGDLPTMVAMRQEGHLRLGARWSPFVATEYFGACPPAFVWDARVRMLPLVTVRVRDSYLAGEGRMHAAIGGLFTVANQAGTPAMAAASLLRWLAEAPWLPVALLPRPGLEWEALDQERARVHLEDHGVKVTLEVRFGPHGGIVEVNAMRHRDVKGAQVLTPWRGRFADYAERGGLTIPLTGEVSWVIDGKEEPYWRGRITNAAFA